MSSGSFRRRGWLGAVGVRATILADAFIPEWARPSSRSWAARAPRSTFPTRTPFSISSATPGPGGGRRGVPQAGDRPRFLRARPSRGGPVANRREPASDHARREHRADGDAAWKTIPSWAVVGTEDRVIPLPHNAAWRSGRARRSPRPRDRTYRWCPIRGRDRRYPRGRRRHRRL